MQPLLIILLYVHIYVASTYYLSPCSSTVTASHWSLEGYRLYTYVTFTYHLSPCSSMVRASHWSSEGYRLYTYVTFTHHLSPCSSMVRASHWSSQGYRLYTYVVQFIFYILHLLLQHLTVYQNITHRFTYIYLFT